MSDTSSSTPADAAADDFINASRDAKATSSKDLRDAKATSGKDLRDAKATSGKDLRDVTHNSSQDTSRPGFFSRLFGAHKSHDDKPTSEEEIKLMVADNDELLEDEKRMIHEIIDLGEATVREIMQPRVDMILAQDNDSVRATIERMHGTGYSRLPVFHDDIDSIIGIVHYKDLIGPLMDGHENDPVSKYAYEPMFVPETKDIFPLLSEMQTNRQQMAIVVDEYGGTDGLITIEDIVEEIVGEIIDESDAENKYITSLGVGVWRVDGRFPVEDALTLGWPVAESDDYETIAGWLIDTIDYVPRTGDEFTFGDYVFKIEKMRRSRISTIKVQAPKMQASTSSPDVSVMSE